MTTFYIAGPMRGYEKFNFPAFDTLAEQLEADGDIAYNPAQHDRDVYPNLETWPGYAVGDVEACPEFDVNAAMAWDLTHVIAADELILLPGWQDSIGATHERYVAEVCGKPIWLAHRAGSTRLGWWTLEFDDVQKRVLSSHTPRSETTIGAYETKDSGERVDFKSGMRRDTDAGKPRYDLIPVMPVRRLAELYARGAVKYGDSNWELADSPEEARRFRASAERHFMQWKAGEDDEDHPTAVVWNIFAALVTEAKLEAKTADADLMETLVARRNDVLRATSRSHADLTRVDL